MKVFLKYPILEKNTHDTRSSLRSGTFPKSRAGLGFHLSWAPYFGNTPTLMLYPTQKS